MSTDSINHNQQREFPLHQHTDKVVNPISELIIDLCKEVENNRPTNESNLREIISKFNKITTDKKENIKSIFNSIISKGETIPHEIVNDFNQAIIQANPEAYKYLPDVIQKDTPLVEGFLHSNYSKSQIYKDLPDELKRDPEVCIDLIMSEPDIYKELLEEMKSHEDVCKTVIRIRPNDVEICEMLVKSNPEMYNYLSEPMQKNMRVYRAFIESTPEMYNNLPNEVKDIIKKDKYSCRTLVRAIPEIYKDFSEEMQKDQIVCRVLMQVKPEMYKDLPEEMQNNINFCVMLIHENPGLYKNLTDKMKKNKEICKIVIETKPEMYNAIPKVTFMALMLENEALCLQFIQKNPEGYKDLPIAMQKNSSIHEAFLLSKMSEGFWICVSATQDKNSDKIYQFKLKDEYDFFNNDIDKRVIDDVSDQLFPAIQIDFTDISMFMDETAAKKLKKHYDSIEKRNDEMIKLGFKAEFIENKLILSIPSLEFLMKKYEVLRNSNPDFYPKLKFEYCDEVSTDQEFIKKHALGNECVDAIVSRDKEFIHDMTDHVASTILRAMEAGPDYLNDMQKYRASCQYWHKKIEEYKQTHPIQKTYKFPSQEKKVYEPPTASQLADLFLASCIDILTSIKKRNIFNQNVKYIENYLRKQFSVKKDYYFSRYGQYPVANLSEDVWNEILGQPSEKRLI